MAETAFKVLISAAVFMSSTFKFGDFTKLLFYI